MKIGFQSKEKVENKPVLDFPSPTVEQPQFLRQQQPESQQTMNIEETFSYAELVIINKLDSIIKALTKAGVKFED
jgi:hypothetical protein